MSAAKALGFYHEETDSGEDSPAQSGGTSAAPTPGPGAGPLPTPSTSGRGRAGGRPDVDEKEEGDRETNSSDDSGADPPVPQPMPSRAPSPLPGNMSEDFDKQNEADEKDAGKQAQQIHLPFDRAEDDLDYWLQRLEARLEFAGVKSQWLKRICLENLLPPDYSTCIKDLLAKKKTGAGNTIYFECKTRLLKVHGKKPETNFIEAQNMVLTDLPSTAGKKMRDLICQQSTKLTNCCCATTLGVHWRALLPPLVRASMAGHCLKTQFEDAMDHADEVFNSMKNPGGASAATVSAVTANLDETQPALDLTAAVNLKKWNNQGRGRGRGQSQRGPGNQKGRDAKPKTGLQEKETPPKGVCSNHARHGKQACYCANLDGCPWHNHIAPPRD